MPSPVSPREIRRDADPRVDVFFYSYYQDTALLRARGAEPRRARPARLRGWRLRLGEHSNLERSPGDSTWGTVFSLTHEEIDRLYHYPGVSGYLPRPVLVETQWGPSLPALCFVLRDAQDDGIPDREHIANLRRVMLARDLPVDALDRILASPPALLQHPDDTDSLREQLRWIRRECEEQGNNGLAACQCGTPELVRCSRDPDRFIAVYCAYAFLDQFVYTHFRNAHAVFKTAFVGPTLGAHGSGGFAHPFWLLDERGHGREGFDQSRVKALFEALVAEGVSWLARHAGVAAARSTEALHAELDGSFLRIGFPLLADDIARRATTSTSVR